MAEAPEQRFDENGIPVQPAPGEDADGRFVYSPRRVARYGQAEYAAYSQSEDKDSAEAKAHLNNALDMASWLLENQEASGAWLYKFAYPVSGMGVVLKSPWASALAQGVAVPFLADINGYTGEQRYLDAAERGLEPLKKGVEDGGLVASFQGRPFYEEYPTDPPSLVLNGFVSALIGLNHLAETNRRSTAGELYRQGYDTLIFALPYYDQRDLPAYHLGHVTNPPREVFVYPDYNELHVEVLKSLNGVTPHPVLEFYIERWSEILEKAGGQDAG